MVEFALVATLFIGLVISLISLVDAIHVKSVADNAVREAARLAIFDYNGTDQAKQLMDDLLNENKTMLGATCTSNIKVVGGPPLLTWTNESELATIDCSIPILFVSQSIFGAPSIHVHAQAEFNRWNPGEIFLIFWPH